MEFVLPVLRGLGVVGQRHGRPPSPDLTAFNLHSAGWGQEEASQSKQRVPEMEQRIRDVSLLFLLTSSGKVMSLRLSCCRTVCKILRPELKSDVKWQCKGFVFVQ